MSKARAVLVALAAGTLLAVLAVGAADQPTPERDPAPGADASVDTGPPVDPWGPWVVAPGHAAVEVGATVEVNLSTPLAVRAEDGPVDEAAVVGPEGRVLVAADCSSGACTISTPLGTRSVPAATITPNGTWHQARTDGFTLEAADGTAQVEARVFDDRGVRLDGDGLAAPVTVTAPLVLEGTPRTVDRLALLGPGGEPVLVVDADGREAARVQVGERTVRADEVHATLHGDPLNDDEVLVRVWVDGQRHGFVVQQTPHGAYQAAGGALEDHLVVRSPTREGSAAITLRAGPATVETEGRLSPAFDVAARVTVEDGTPWTRGWLTVDGTPRAELTASGSQQDARVLHGVLEDDLEGEHAEIGARLERRLAPGLVQVQHVDPVSVHLDDQGPPPPSIQPSTEGASITWPNGSAARWEAQARPPEGDWRPIPTEDREARLPEGPHGEWEARVRGVDDVGNEGPWSEPVVLERGGEDAEPTHGQARLALTAPEPGDHLSGTARIAWQPDPATATVRADVRTSGEAPWQRVAEGSNPPLTWDTRTVPDGDHTLRVTAEGPGGPTTRLLAVTVDNLDPIDGADTGAFLGEGPDPTRGGDGAAMPGTPLPQALAAGLALIGLGAGVARLR